jgi:hypothetical protein
MYVSSWEVSSSGSSQEGRLLTTIDKQKIARDDRETYSEASLELAPTFRAAPSSLKWKKGRLIGQRDRIAIYRLIIQELRSKCEQLGERWSEWSLASLSA